MLGLASASVAPSGRFVEGVLYVVYVEKGVVGDRPVCVELEHTQGRITLQLRDA